MRNPVAFHAEMMEDIMYLHQVLKQKDAFQFVDAVIQEINGHIDNEHWDLVKQDSVPNNAQIVPSVSVCLVTLAQAHLNNQHDYQAQSQIESPWWQAGLWHELL
jgi:hypothetical protein